MVIRSEPPVDLGREQAQRAAQQELTDPVYATAAPSLPERVIRAVLDWLSDVLSAAADASPGGYAGLLVLAVLLVLGVIAVRLRIGRIGHATTRESALLGTGSRSAEDHRRAADAHAARGEWAEALRETLRAIVRGLEERDLLDVRPGRTADEAASEAGAVLPERAAQLRTAATLFDEVWYGGRAATPEMDAHLRAVDDAVGRTRPVAAAGPGR